MLFTYSYFTIENPGTGIYKEKGSKFIGCAYPAITELEIKEYINHIKKEHFGARHFCYAWRLGADKQNYRMNDDGEPNNTAGKPIYSQILSNDLTNILIIVVRYFGGTLLGTGGLIQAYKEAAADALKNTQIIERFIYFRYQLVFHVNDINHVMKLCKELHAEIISQDYTENYTLVFNIKKAVEPILIEKLKLLYNANLTFLKTL